MFIFQKLVLKSVSQDNSKKISDLNLQICIPYSEILIAGDE